MPPADAVAEEATVLLRRLGADVIAHPGGTLLAHLQRVRARLGLWRARPVLQLAGLCHASYGTDGFPTALLPLDRRAELAAVIGDEAEAIVYLYASCDRRVTYAAFPHSAAGFRDRFTGRERAPGTQPIRDFAELTAANELDLARIDPAFRAQHGPGLLALFTRFRNVLSADAWQECRTVLG
ncbi:DUF6817 domain-containing protein [Streptomyces cinnamoneus]|uniref:DUF6817 domain-containing protein n=1 Tax=Streptomyces cinnamoneus TaxID=53446 RepID=A0A918TRF7_STRCJ|nr:hypothetical protein [Streptomyces cinnamoneus]GHC60098.1 hypothetical protein GCM10010507_41390 [Streptomyces cinnamoneus]